MGEHRVSCVDIGTDLHAAVREALAGAGVLDRITSSTRVAIKPNLTYPYYKQGVTTSPATVRECVRIVRERTSHVRIVETDGGYGAWLATEAFAGHGFDRLATEFDIRVDNLRDEPSEDIEILRKSWGSKVDPLLDDPSAPYNTRAVIDACRPFEKLATFPRVAQASPARVRETVAKWNELFTDSRFPLPATVVPSGAVDEQAHGGGVTAMDKKD